MCLRVRVRSLLGHDQMKLAAQTLDFDPAAGPAHLVVNFIALLELVKEGLVRLLQEEQFGDISVSLHDGSSQPVEEAA